VCAQERGREKGRAYARAKYAEAKKLRGKKGGASRDDSDMVFSGTFEPVRLRLTREDVLGLKGAAF
jgi:hypothetical protein